MYLQHYGFTTDPFHITPDPRFFFLGSSHREAYASMVYGLKKRKGFIAVIGEVGLGKTTVVRSFLKQKSNQTELKTIFVFNPALSFRGLLHHIFEELEIELPRPKHVESDDTSELVKKLHKALIEEYAKGNLIVLVIDEAQNMPVETLENLRMLSNLETTQSKLLQIFLVGQPELERKLNQPELRQLKQRLAIRSTLKPLNRRESARYIEHRLKKAGLRKQTIFNRRAIRRIYRYAKGNPRIINILCDNALVTGFGYGATHIGPGIIEEVRKDIQGARDRPRKLVWSAVISIALLLAGGGFWYSPYGGSLKSHFLELPGIKGVLGHKLSMAADSAGTTETATRQETPTKESRTRLAIRTLEPPPSARSSPLPDGSFPEGQRFELSTSLSDASGAESPEKQAPQTQQQAPPSYEDSVLPAQLDEEGQAIRKELVWRMKVFRKLSPVRQKVIVEMAKQTSIRGVMTFDRMIAALEEQDFLEAARQMIHSNWGDRVGLHAIKLAEVMYTGHPQGWDRPELAVDGGSGE